MSSLFNDDTDAFFDEIEHRVSNQIKYTKMLIAGLMVFGMLILGGLAFVAYHFVSKVW